MGNHKAEVIITGNHVAVLTIMCNYVDGVKSCG